MAFDHEKLDVYQLAVDFVARANDVVESLPRGRGYLADQLQRAALSIVLNVAEGAGKFSGVSHSINDHLNLPPGGTPGFAVLDLRVGYRIEEKLLLSLVMENVLDTPYRYHGSSVNGPGRGMVLLLDVGPIWGR